MENDKRNQMSQSNHVNTTSISVPEKTNTDNHRLRILPMSKSDIHSSTDNRKTSGSRSIPTTVTVPTKRPSKAKSKHKKPEGMPRRPLSAYNFFYKAERVNWLEEQKELKKQEVSTNTNASSTQNDESKKSDFLEMGKAISQRWRMLTSDDREPYERQAKEDLDRYHREMDVFNMNLVRSYKGSEKLDRMSTLESRISNMHEVSMSQGSVQSNSAGSSSQSITQDCIMTQMQGIPLLQSLQLLLPLLQQDGSTRLPSTAPAIQPSSVSTTNVLNSLLRQLLEQRLVDERLTEVRALLSELQQILAMQLQLQQYFQRQQVVAQPVLQSAPPIVSEDGLNEACSALLSLVNHLM